jgi:hypothetical protein
LNYRAVNFVGARTVNDTWKAQTQVGSFTPTTVPADNFSRSFLRSPEIMQRLKASKRMEKIGEPPTLDI